MHNPTVVHRHAVLGLSGVPASLCACVPPAYVKYYTQEDTPATGLVAEPKGASPPRQLELAPPGTAEFVICDHTIEIRYRYGKLQALGALWTGGSPVQHRTKSLCTQAKQIRVPLANGQRYKLLWRELRAGNAQDS